MQMSKTDCYFIPTTTQLIHSKYRLVPRMVSRGWKHMFVFAFYHKMQSQTCIFVKLAPACKCAITCFCKWSSWGFCRRTNTRLCIFHFIKGDETTEMLLNLNTIPLRFLLKLKTTILIRHFCIQGGWHVPIECRFDGKQKVQCCVTFEVCMTIPLRWDSSSIEQIQLHISSPGRHWKRQTSHWRWSPCSWWPTCPTSSTSSSARRSSRTPIATPPSAALSRFLWLFT